MRSYAPVERYCPTCASVRECSVWAERWGYLVVRCTDCALGITLVPDGFDPTIIYEEGYYEGRAEGGLCAYGSYSADEPFLRKEFSGVVNRLSRVRPSGRLLEIGCAYGYFLMEARRCYEVVGLEVSSHAVDIARSRDLDVRPQSLLEAAFPGGSFDVVVMLDVIEHLPDPRATLQEVLRVLSPGGVVLITTGDAGSLHARLLARYWRLMTPPQHLFYFSRGNLRALLQDLGFVDFRARTPWKFVPWKRILYQAHRWYGLPAWLQRAPLGWGMHVNLFDTMECLARAPYSRGESNRKAEVNPT